MGPYRHRRMEGATETTIYERIIARGPTPSSSEGFSEVEGRRHSYHDPFELQSGGIIYNSFGEEYSDFSDANQSD